MLYTVNISQYYSGRVGLYGRRFTSLASGEYVVRHVLFVSGIIRDTRVQWLKPPRAFSENNVNNHTEQ